MYELQRTCEVVIEAGGTTRKVTVTQLRKEIELSASPAELSTGAAGGQHAVGVICNAAWTVASEASWIDCGGTLEYEGTTTLTLTCEPNTSQQQRTANVVITAGSKRAAVAVVQAPGELPEAGTPDTAAVQKYQASFTFTVQSEAFPVTEYGIECTAQGLPPVRAAVTGTGQRQATVTVDVPGLESGTEYTATAYAENAVGRAYSQPITFTTKGTTPGDNDNPRPSKNRKR